MNYATIKYYDIANGSGVRSSLFVSGCTHACKGCFNPEAWDFKYGKEFNKEVAKEILKSLEPDYIAGLSLLGGEPFEPENQKGLIDFIREYKKRFPNKNLWCYTGFTYEKDLLQGGIAHIECTDELLSYIDVLVDGKFIEELHDVSLRFRGSKNQRLINLKKTREGKEIVLWEK